MKHPHLCCVPWFMVAADPQATPKFITCCKAFFVAASRWCLPTLSPAPTVCYPFYRRAAATFLFACYQLWQLPISQWYYHQFCKHPLPPAELHPSFVIFYFGTSPAFYTARLDIGFYCKFFFTFQCLQRWPGSINDKTFCIIFTEFAVFTINHKSNRQTGWCTHSWNNVFRLKERDICNQILYNLLLNWPAGNVNSNWLLVSDSSTTQFSLCFYRRIGLNEKIFSFSSRLLSISPPWPPGRKEPTPMKV